MKQLKFTLKEVLTMIIILNCITLTSLKALRSSTKDREYTLDIFDKYLKLNVHEGFIDVKAEGYKFRANSKEYEKLKDATKNSFNLDEFLIPPKLNGLGSDIYTVPFCKIRSTSYLDKDKKQLQVKFVQQNVRPFVIHSQGKIMRDLEDKLNFHPTEINLWNKQSRIYYRFNYYDNQDKNHFELKIEETAICQHISEFAGNAFCKMLDGYYFNVEIPWLLFSHFENIDKDFEYLVFKNANKEILKIKINKFLTSNILVSSEILSNYNPVNQPQIAEELKDFIPTVLTIKKDNVFSWSLKAFYRNQNFGENIFGIDFVIYKHDFEYKKENYLTKTKTGFEADSAKICDILTQISGTASNFYAPFNKISNLEYSNNEISFKLENDIEIIIKGNKVIYKILKDMKANSEKFLKNFKSFIEKSEPMCIAKEATNCANFEPAHNHLCINKILANGAIANLIQQNSDYNSLKAFFGNLCRKYGTDFNDTIRDYWSLLNLHHVTTQNKEEFGRKITDLLINSYFDIKS